MSTSAPNAHVLKFEVECCTNGYIIRWWTRDSMPSHYTCVERSVEQLLDRIRTILGASLAPQDGG